MDNNERAYDNHQLVSDILEPFEFASQYVETAIENNTITSESLSNNDRIAILASLDNMNKRMCVILPVHHDEMIYYIIEKFEGCIDTINNRSEILIRISKKVKENPIIGGIIGFLLTWIVTKFITIIYDVFVMIFF